MAQDYPQTLLDSFKTQLKKDGLPSVVLIYGPEGYFRGEGLKLALAAAGDLEVQQMDGATETRVLESLGPDLRTASLFGTGKVIVLRESLVWQGRGAVVKVETLVNDFLARPTPGIHLIILRDGKVDGRSKMIKGMKKTGGTIINCRTLYATPFPGRPPWQTELHSWFADQARRRKLKIERQELEFIIMVLGRAPGALASFLDRLKVHLPEDAAGRVSLELLEKVLGHGGQANQFELAAALLKGDFAASLTLARSLMTGGLQDQGGKLMDPAGALLVTMNWIHRSVAQCYRGKLLLAAGWSRAEVENELGLRFFKDRYWAEVKASSQDRLESLLAALLRADRILKTANEIPARILENFIIEASLHENKTA